MNTKREMKKETIKTLEEYGQKKMRLIFNNQSTAKVRSQNDLFPAES